MSPNNIEKNKSPLDSGSEGIVELQQRIQSLKQEIEDFRKQTLNTNTESKDQEKILHLLQDIEKRVNQFDQLDEDKKKSEIESLEQALEILTSTKSALSKLKKENFETIQKSQTLIDEKLPRSSSKANEERAIAANKISNIEGTNWIAKLIRKLSQ